MEGNGSLEMNLLVPRPGSPEPSSRTQSRHPALDAGSPEFHRKVESRVKLMSGFFRALP